MIRYPLLAALLLASPAIAQTQAQMNQTAGRQYQAADAAMTRQWQRTYAYMKGRDAQDRSRGGGFGYAAATLASQRAWLQFRDTQCVIEGGEYAGGSMQSLVQAQCKTRLTNERTTQLGKLLWKNR
ncbi:lysozyme inhibitor LprI family protein [Sphingomonadaceae bacterium OTU29THOMA1]|nr:lysozyme inhibitor LprI family protein [Sphingomonadaceae bacterium OTU29THOMA1]